MSAGAKTLWGRCFLAQLFVTYARRLGITVLQRGKRANFLGGAFEFLGAFVAPFIVRNCPQGAFLAPIAGIGMTWLGINPLVQLLSSPAAHNPIVGFLPFVLVWLNAFATNKLLGSLWTSESTMQLKLNS